MKNINPVLFLIGILFVVLAISMYYNIRKVHEGLDNVDSSSKNVNSDNTYETPKPTESSNVSIPTFAPLPCPDPNISRINNFINMMNEENISNAYNNLENVDKYLFKCSDNKKYLKDQLKKLDPAVILNLGAFITNLKSFLTKIDGVLPTTSV